MLKSLLIDIQETTSIHQVCVRIQSWRGAHRGSNVDHVIGNRCLAEIIGCMFELINS